MSDIISDNMSDKNLAAKIALLLQLESKFKLIIFDSFFVSLLSESSFTN